MWAERLPVVRTWPAKRQRTLVEGLRFLTVGGMNYVVDVGVFNALRATVMTTMPVTAKVFSVIVATLFSWVMNRSWTFSTRARRPLWQEFTSFMVINALGLVPPIVCLWISHYLLDFTSQLADNISANIIGVALGTLLRYVGYSAFVFKAPTSPAEDPAAPASADPTFSAENGE